MKESKVERIEVDKDIQSAMDAVVDEWKESKKH